MRNLAAMRCSLNAIGLHLAPPKLEITICDLDLIFSSRCIYNETAWVEKADILSNRADRSV